MSGLADASRFAVDTASEELQPWMVNPYGEAQKRAVMSNMSLEGLEKFNKILPSVSNRLTSDWLSRQEEAKKNAGDCCYYCGKKCKLTLDHFDSLSKGGAHCVSNFVFACFSCNSRKLDLDPFEFMESNLAISF